MRPRILLPLLLLLPACGNLKNLHTKAQAERRQKELTKLAEAATSEASGRLGEKAVGEVSYVDDASGYVLIRARAGLALADGTELECRGSDGKLRVTPERKNAFVAADIISGVPEKGDAVVVVNSTARSSLRLVPVNAPPSLPGGTEPSGVVTLDSNSLRPDVLPQSTLGEPGGVNAPNFERSPDMTPPEGADILLEPPLPR
jgi:hypothetical protein